MSSPAGSKNSEALDELLSVIDRLIAPNGCPWDKEQTPLSLSEYLIEECFELVEAIRSGTRAEVCDEMGDVLFLLVFMASLYAKDNSFSFHDALAGAAAKMIRRHPHVFAGEQIEKREELFTNWERIKQEEKKNKPKKSGVFEGLASGLPALTKAYRIHAKAAGVGFTWPEDEEVEVQAEAEWLELLDAQSADDTAALQHEYGDYLFTLVELGRRKGIKASIALDEACARFLQRFSLMEKMAEQKQQKFSDLSLDEKDELWNEAKAQHQSKPVSNPRGEDNA